LNEARRRFLIGTTAAMAVGMGGISSAALRPTIRIGLTPVILDDQTRFLNRWREWLETRLGTSVAFVQRPRYRDITDLLLNRKLTAAWICGYPYVRHQSKLRLLAVPVYQGNPLYRSLVISGTLDRTPASLEQMKGQVFAFSDPDSNSGYLYPMYRLRDILATQPDFFRRTFFSWGHRNTIEAVASGLADGGAVDSYVWDSIVHQHPQYADQIRIVERSPEFGFPPIVTHQALPDSIHANLAATLLQMHADPEGLELLGTLYLDRFESGDTADYSGIARLMTATNQLGLSAS
jgi:phosphonate transport system substrate-binding protein